MTNCALICEYNPFHTGHKYQLDRMRERVSGSIVCVMSGNIVQSAKPAFCDKSIRAESALLGGADCVIELPALYATASAGYFAEGALKIISGIKDIGMLAMGAVSPPELIKHIADVKVSRADAFGDRLRSHMKTGKSYNAASVAVLCELCDGVKYTQNDIAAALADPNNMLCVEYISAIDRYAPNIEPLIIERVASRHNDTGTDCKYVSATAIRTAVENGHTRDIEQFVPFNFEKMLDWRAKHAPDLRLFEKLCVFFVKTHGAEYISRLLNCSEGMEHAIKAVSRMSDYAAYTDSASCRRYGKKRIDRLMLDCVLGIEKDMPELPFVTRLLGCRCNFDYGILPDRVKTNNADIKSAAKSDSGIARVLAVDERAAALYGTVCGIDGDFYNYSLVKV